MNKKNDKNDYATKDDVSELKNRMDRIDNRIDGLDKRVDGLDKRVLHIEHDVKEIKTHFSTKADVEKMLGVLKEIKSDMKQYATKDEVTKIKSEVEGQINQQYRWGILVAGGIFTFITAVAGGAWSIIKELLPK